ncbi:MAG: DUF1330 domain-containing protein [Acidimicrobiales bacterium]|jgi:uncharacterized protein (DUF1330 family)
MAAYIIAEIAVTDTDGYETYKALAGASVAAHGGTYLARGGHVESLEGEPAAARVVILEFPDLESARAFYTSEDYRAAIAVRHATASSRLFIVEGRQAAG